MSIRSMTAFASSHGHDPGSYDDSASPADWIWEIRSVNARGLDVRLRLPREFELLELVIREIISKYCKRGAILLTLTIKQNSNQEMLCLDEDVLTRLISLTSEWHRRCPDWVHLPRLDGLFSLPGVLVPCERNAQRGNRQEREAAVLLSLERALDLLVTMRIEEGRKLAEVIDRHLNNIDSIIKMADARAETQFPVIFDRIHNSIEILLQKFSGISEERLVQEAAILAARANVREELDRLGAHVLAIRQLLTAGGIVGRRLDFLCQELNREANTLCTKANSLDLTYLGIDLKTAIDQLREQVQNLE